MDDAVARARAAVLREFRWIDGHSDLWRLAEDATTFEAVVAGLSALAATCDPTEIAGVETRGVLFGAPVARALGLGFHTIRKGDGLFAGARHSAASAPDYRGATHTLRFRGASAPGARVVLVDDWIEAAGATLAGVVTIVDQSDGSLAPRSLVNANELPSRHGE